MITLETVIKFALFLLVAFIVILIVRSKGYDSVEDFLSVFSLAERCDDRTSSDFKELIEGYAEQSEVVEQFQACDWYRRCFSEDFAVFEEKNREGGEPLCEVAP